MRTKILSRDKTNSRGFRIDNFLDYEAYKYKMSLISNTNILSKKAMLSLIQYVINNELTEKQREAVELVKIKGFTSREASKILNVNPSSICRRLKLAQRKFDLALEHYDTVKHILWRDE